MRLAAACSCLLTALGFGLAPTAEAYSCDGTGCCNYVCDGSDVACTRSSSGVSIPEWWTDERNGWQSCADKVSANYDASIPCSQGIRPDYPCGHKEGFACGYGLACVPETIAYAQCIPICGSRYPGGGGSGPEAEALNGFDTSKVAAGCTLDGQSGKTNPTGGYPLDVGNVAIVDGVAVPACVSASLLNLGTTSGIDGGGSGGGGSTPTTTEPGPSGSSTDDDMVEQQEGGTGSGSTSNPVPQPLQPPVVPAPPLQEAPPALTDLSEGQRARRKLANQVTGLVMGFYEGQRAGPKGETAHAYPQVWRWKRESFTDSCSTLRAIISAESESTGADLQSVRYPGIFEAGSAPPDALVVTGTSAFTTALVAMGAQQFGEVYETRPLPLLPDPKKCLPLGFNKYKTNALVRNFLRIQAHAMLAAVIQYEKRDPDAFVMLTGISDSRGFNELPSWQQPRSIENRCYVATAQKPAADIAGNLATALALVAHYFRTASGTGPYMRGPLANACQIKAEAAYEYAKAQFEAKGMEATCADSPAAANCIGDCAGATTPGCLLYKNVKTAQQDLFTSAAALWQLTGKAKYRNDADNWWDPDVAPGFYYNWNNVYPTGVIVLASSEDLPGAKRSRAYYLQQLGVLVQKWAECSNDGKFGTECERTDGGGAYPVDVSNPDPNTVAGLSRGNIGMGMNAVCAAGIYDKLMRGNGTEMQLGCFMERQLGFTTNNKCDGARAMFQCNTGSSEGYSYIVGLGNFFPTHLHARDAIPGKFYSNPGKADENTLCGAVVSGPAQSESYTDTRSDYSQSEPAIDYAAGALCAFGAYAMQPSSALNGCGDVRTPFTGRP